MPYSEANDWTGDTHRSNGAVHHRLYLAPTGATVICVQDFDYFDYDARLILSPDAWTREGDAVEALVALAPVIADATGRLAAVSTNVRSYAVASAVRNYVLRNADQ